MNKERMRIMGNKFGNILWGVGMILAAILLLGNSMGMLDLGDVGFFSLIMTLFLVVILINGVRKVNFFEILFSLGFLGIIYDEALGIEEITPWPILGAALLCSIGLELIFGNVKKRVFGKNKSGFVNGCHSHHGHTTAFCDDKSQVYDNVVRCDVKFGSSAKYVNAQAFERAEIDCSFGDAKIYLTNAVLKTSQAEVHVNVSFGSATIYMPRTWRVEKQVNVSMGDYKEKGVQQLMEGGPVIYLSGKVSMGDVTVVFM